MAISGGKGELEGHWETVNGPTLNKHNKQKPDLPWCNKPGLLHCPKSLGAAEPPPTLTPRAHSQRGGWRMGGTRKLKVAQIICCSRTDPTRPPNRVDVKPPASGRSQYPFPTGLGTGSQLRI